MSWHTIKRDRADILFSEYVRLRDKRCQYDGCTYYGTGEKGIVGLDASHFYSRGKESVRFNPLNVDAMCRKHHKWLGEHRTEYEAWKLKQLGQVEYDKLLVSANSYCKKDRQLALIYVKSLLKTL
jgi:hypothetical protein